MLQGAILKISRVSAKVARPVKPITRRMDGRVRGQGLGAEHATDGEAHCREQPEPGHR